MKRFLTLLCLFAGSLNMAVAQHDNLINLSPEWIRSAARNTATDASDATVYNPAGVVRMGEGFHISIGNQMLIRKPTHTFDLGMGMGEQSFTQDGADMFLPNLYLSYNTKYWALFSGIYVSGGGATVNFPQGSINTDLAGMQVLSAMGGAYTTAANQSLKAKSFYLTSFIGVSLALTDRLSFAASGRMIDARNSTEAGMTFTDSPILFPDQPFQLNTEERAHGFGGMFGVMFKATPQLDLSLRYETNVKLDFETKTTTDDFGMTTDGDMNRRDLPGVLALGAAYNMNTQVKICADINYYMQTSADWGTSTMLTSEKNYAELAGDAIYYGLAMNYQAGNNWMLSIGAGYSDFMYDDQDGYFTKLGAFETVPDDNYNINTGFSFRASSAVTLTFGYMHTFYKQNEINALMAQPLEVKVKTENSVDALALGVNLQF